MKNEALLLELDLLDTVHCPKIIAVFDGPYWAKVGLVFKPFLIPRCCPNRFSTMSEFKYPGLMVFFPFNLSLHKETNPIKEEFKSLLVSCVIRFLVFTFITDFSTSLSHELKKERVSIIVSNLLSSIERIGCLVKQNISTICVVCLRSLMLTSRLGVLRVDL